MDSSPTENFEHAEHARHAAHIGDSFLSSVSVTIAVLAVLTAAVSSLETTETAEMISAKNDAVFFQNKETDQWNFYQAKRLKKAMYAIAAAAGGPNAANYSKRVGQYESDSRAVQKQANQLERQKNEELQASDRHEHRHHFLTVAATLLQVSIAVATVSIITRGMRWPWYGSMALGLTGVAIAAWAYR
ncbi:MAG TPA: DUF4337 domain-containing protein [Beijerinckiaceae bacterium]|nr:DUF4337 domain-containing protein [Beijerinckiaceae bacterium]